MALFDNPFIGVFRSQKQREQEAAEKMAQQKAQQQQAKSAAIQKAQSVIGPSNPYDNIKKQNTMYAFGGGTIGDVWQKAPPVQDPITGKMREGGYKLKPQFANVASSLTSQDMIGRPPSGMKQQKIAVLPAGAGGRQELSYLKKIAEEKNIPWVEAPVKYTRGMGTNDKFDRKDQFYSPTGQPMGSIGFWSAGYGGFGYSPNVAERRGTSGQTSTGKLEPAGRGLGPVTDPWIRRQQLSNVAQTPSTSMGMSGNVASFTGFGQRMGNSPQPTASFTPSAPSPFQQQPYSMTGFGGYPMFPWSGY